MLDRLFDFLLKPGNLHKLFERRNLLVMAWDSFAEWEWPRYDNEHDGNGETWYFGPFIIDRWGDD